MSTEITTIEHPQTRIGNPLDLAPSEFREALTRRSENRRALIEWIRASLVDGVDFGAVPLRRGGYSKPSLRKPGAEKICGMLGVTAQFPTLPQYEQAALDGRRLEQITLRCHLSTQDGQIVADGVGSRSVEQDRGDLNKALKMAVKSAMIDATLRMAGLSEIFTQDIEDMPHGAIEGDEPQRRAQASEPGTVPCGKHKGKKWEEVGDDYLAWAVGAPSAPADLQHGARKEIARREQSTGGIDESEAIPHEAPAAAAAGPAPSGEERHATDRQIKLIRVRLERAGIAESELLERFGVPDVESLPFAKVSPALHWIDALAG